MLPGMLTAALALSGATQAAAQPGGDETGWYARIGALALAMPKYEGGDRYKLRPLPVVKITYDNQFFLSHHGLGINLTPHSEVLEVNVAVGYDGGRGSGKAAALTGYRSIGDTAVGRLMVDYRIGAVKLHADIATDLLGDGHGGTQATIGINCLSSPYGDATLVVGPSLTWASGGYMHSFFSTTPDRLNDAARTGQVVPGSRIGFDAGSGLKNAGLSAILIHPLGDSWSLIGHAGYARMLGDAADSPFVKDNGSRDQFSGGLGLSYTF
ncbi:MipA/OmpV family protein [Niveispirillum sp. KHB5.9]|uniref:MipA/OmpV family protein n=1 Tax=Niveispirillum sp. KHB5.9 TaxID=3400269 RepID=UPI003A8540BF